MLIAVHELELHAVEFDQPFAAGEFPLQQPDIDRVGPVRFQGIARPAGGGLRIQGHLRGELFPLCARCLEPVAVQVDRELDLLYQPEAVIAEGGEVEIHQPDTDLAFFAGEGVETDDVAREQLLLELPMQILCRPDCRGLCPRCGANLNPGACACPPLAEKNVERWPDLKSLGGSDFRR